MAALARFFRFCAFVLLRWAVGGGRWGNGARGSKNGQNGDVEGRKETEEGRGGAVLGCFGGFLRLVQLPDGVESLGAFNGNVNGV